VTTAHTANATVMISSCEIARCRAALKTSDSVNSEICTTAMPFAKISVLLLSKISPSDSLGLSLITSVLRRKPNWRVVSAIVG
jgi:hypothetical protein